MLELNTVFDILYADIKPAAEKLGFAADIPVDTEKGATPVFMRDSSKYLAFSGEKGKIRILYSDNKIRLLTASADATSEDDSDYTLSASYLLVIEEYNDKDVKSVANEITEDLSESFSSKQLAKKQQVKAQATVSRSAVKNGSSLYDATTLAMRLATIYPELKDLYKNNIETYGEFLCEDFFTKDVNPRVFATLKESNPQKIKKLFNILNEIFDDGTNEVQDIIIVTMLSSYELDTKMHQCILDYASDSLVEPFIRVYKYLKSSKSARMRLANPPKYKPKKAKKKKSMMSSLMGQQ